MALINDLPETAVDNVKQDKDGAVTLPDVRAPWRAWFQAVRAILGALTMSGTTAQRPTTFLFAGRPYFDTSLGANGKPIWRNKGSTGWVDATGAAV